MRRIADQYDSPLDLGIARAVDVLRAGGIETFESCEGGDGHAYPEPTVRFYGNIGEGYRALAIALTADLRVMSLRRTWPIIDNCPTGPWWELTFTQQAHTPAPAERRGTNNTNEDPAPSQDLTQPAPQEPVRMQANPNVECGQISCPCVNHLVEHDRHDNPKYGSDCEKLNCQPVDAALQVPVKERR